MEYFHNIIYNYVDVNRIGEIRLCPPETNSKNCRNMSTSYLEKILPNIDFQAQAGTLCTGIWFGMPPPFDEQWPVKVHNDPCFKL